MSKPSKFAISPLRSENFPEWYQSVVKAAELAEMSPVRGCMVIKPWGYGIWERIQAILDGMIKATGHENAYFPLFIPLSYLEREADHVAGFSKECAVVTHHRLEEKKGKLVPAAPLEEPLIVRPTSETIIGASFAKWIHSYRDLPVLINQWANVVRWELRTRLFLRTSEFLWQEGHTAHATSLEAHDETLRMLGVYRSLAEDHLAMPVIAGEKSKRERFPGAESTYSIEAMMQDGKALQAGTSHFLGQTFARAANIKFLDSTDHQQYPYTTSWGVSTRLIGGVVMTHADDDGLRVPPRIAPKHVVVIPLLKPGSEDQVLAYAQSIADGLRSIMFEGKPQEVLLDKRDIPAFEKKWQWIKRGIPVRIEVGPRDVDSENAVLARRDEATGRSLSVPKEKMFNMFPQLLTDIQNAYLNKARTFLTENTRSDITDFESLEAFLGADSKRQISGFVSAKWCESPDCEERLAGLGITIRCQPLDQSRVDGSCIVCGRKGIVDVILAKAY